jgi:hypothetical protein
MTTRALLTILVALVLGLLTSCAGFDPQAYVPGLETPTYTPVPEAVSPVPVTATIMVAKTETSAKTIVCTNIPGGKLNVRLEAGNQSDVRGYLSEGETVTTSGERKELDGSLWVRLSHPIEGWVNAIYLCNVKL